MKRDNSTKNGRSSPPGNIKSVFPYPGGKGRRSDWLLSRMPDHDCYVEVFGGSGALMYNKPRARVEVYNDTNDDLVHFFNTLRERADDLLEWLRCVPYSRSLYDEWAEAYFKGDRVDDPVARAGRFYALRYMQFGGDIRMRNGFKTRAKRSPARTFDNARERLFDIRDRFNDVIVEHKDYAAVLEQYDDTDVDVLFYCDPPYVGSEHYYGSSFDHERFVEALHGVESRWMVSYADLPPGLEQYHTVKRTRRHRMATGASEATERLVCNFDPGSVPTFVDGSHTQQTLSTNTS